MLLPQFEVRHPQRHVAQGRLAKRDQVENLWKDRSLVNIGPQFKGYPEDQLEVIPSLEIQTFSSQQPQALSAVYEPGAPLALAAGDYRILDLGTNLTGLVGATLECSGKSRCWFVFDEILSDGDVDFKRLGCVNLVSYELEPGRYEVESIEPYTLRYLKLICVEGACAVQQRAPAGVQASEPRRGGIRVQRSAAERAVTEPASRHSGRTRWTSSWTVRRGSVPAGCATATSRRASPET